MRIFIVDSGFTPRDDLIEFLYNASRTMNIVHKNMVVYNIIRGSIHENHHVSQSATIANNIKIGFVSSGDRFLFTDSLTPSLMFTRQYTESNGIFVNIHAMWQSNPHIDSPNHWKRAYEDAIISATDTNIMPDVSWSKIAENLFL